MNPELDLALWSIDLATNSARWLVADIGFYFEICFREYESDDFSPTDLRIYRIERPANFGLSLRATKSLIREARALVYAEIRAELEPFVQYDQKPTLPPGNDFPEAA